MTPLRSFVTLSVVIASVASHPVPTPLVYPPYPRGYHLESGVLIPGSAGKHEYALDWLSHGNHTEIWFGRDVLTSPEPTWELQDSLILPAYPRSQVVVMAECSLRGSPDFELIALAKQEDADSFRTIVRAWRADRSTNRIVQVAVAGIACANEGYGV